MDRMLIVFLLIINVLTFALFGIDKWKAIHGKWRIRESTLLGLSLAGGTMGALAAMYLFRHKTKKVPFKIGLPMMLIIQAILLLYFRL